MIQFTFLVSTPNEAKKFKQESISDPRTIIINKTMIENLDSYSLTQVFSNLSIVDRIKIEGVSKSWKILARESWSTFKHLDLQRETWGFKSHIDASRIKKVNFSNLEKVLSRCGKYLVSLDIEYLIDKALASY